MFLPTAWKMTDELRRYKLAFCAHLGGRNQIPNFEIIVEFEIDNKIHKTGKQATGEHTKKSNIYSLPLYCTPTAALE
jgi:hypothetical protein